MSTADEMWRNIPGVPGYQASTLGRVRSIDRVVIAIDGRVCPLRGKVLSASPIGKHDGHLKVCLACGRARSRRRFMLTKGVDLDLQQLSDAYFAEIMSRSIDDRRSA